METLWRIIKSIGCGLLAGIVLLLTILGLKGKSDSQEKLKSLKTEEKTLKEALTKQEEETKTKEETVAQDREELQKKYNEQMEKVKEIEALKQSENEKIEQQVVDNDDLQKWLNKKGLTKDE